MFNSASDNDKWCYFEIIHQLRIPRKAGFLKKKKLSISKPPRHLGRKVERAKSWQRREGWKGSQIVACWSAYLLKAFFIASNSIWETETPDRAFSKLTEKNYNSGPPKWQDRNKRFEVLVWTINVHMLCMRILFCCYKLLHNGLKYNKFIIAILEARSPICI